MDINLRRHEKIKFLLKLQNVSLSMIARDLCVSPGAITNVCKRDSKSKRIEDEIAARLELSSDELWLDDVDSTKGDLMT